jgi:hypothetical protein
MDQGPGGFDSWSKQMYRTTGSSIEDGLLDVQIYLRFYTSTRPRPPPQFLCKIGKKSIYYIINETNV